MNLHVSASTFTPALAGLVPLAEGTTPAHTAVVLDATDGTLRLSAGQQIAGWATVAATVTEPGRVAVNAQRLAAIVKAGGAEVVTIKSDDRNRVIVECGGKYTLNGDDPADVPGPPELADAESVDIPGPDIAAAIDVVSMCVSQDDNKYGLNMARIEADGEAGRIVTTDGNRLAYAPLPVPLRTDFPRVFMVALRRMLGDGAVTLRWTRERIAAEADTWGLSSSRVHGDFPDYRQVLPATHKRAVTIPASELAAAVARVRPLASGAFTEIRIDIRADGLTLTARNVDAGTATATVEAEVVGESMIVGINAAYLSDALRVFGADVVTIRLGDVLGPITVTSPARPGVMHVLMPLRID